MTPRSVDLPTKLAVCIHDAANASLASATRRVSSSYGIFTFNCAFGRSHINSYIQSVNDASALINCTTGRTDKAIGEVFFAVGKPHTYYLNTRSVPSIHPIGNRDRESRRPSTRSQIMITGRSGYGSCGSLDLPDRSLAVGPVVVNASRGTRDGRRRPCA